MAGMEGRGNEKCTRYDKERKGLRNILLFLGYQPGELIRWRIGYGEENRGVGRKGGARQGVKWRRYRLFLSTSSSGKVTVER